jgi:hypothetical protein
VSGTTDTTITAAPSGIVLSRAATVSFSSPNAGASFQCQLDGAAWAACSSPVTYANLSSRTHTFRVRALVGGVADTTPATARWTVPHDDRAMTASAGWTRPAGSTAFLGTLSRAASAGRTLTKSSVTGKRVSLVASPCAGCGSVSVRWNGTLIGTVSLAGPPASQVVILVAAFTTARSGPVVLTTTSAAAVLIDGLAIES